MDHFKVFCTNHSTMLLWWSISTTKVSKVGPKGSLHWLSVAELDHKTFLRMDSSVTCHIKRNSASSDCDYDNREVQPGWLPKYLKVIDTQRNVMSSPGVSYSGNVWPGRNHSMRSAVRPSELCGLYTQVTVQHFYVWKNSNTKSE